MRISDKDLCHTSDFNFISISKGIFTKALQFSTCFRKIMLFVFLCFSLLTLIVEFENKESVS